MSHSNTWRWAAMALIAGVIGGWALSSQWKRLEDTCGPRPQGHILGVGSAGSLELGRREDQKKLDDWLKCEKSLNSTTR